MGFTSRPDKRAGTGPSRSDPAGGRGGGGAMGGGSGEDVGGGGWWDDPDGDELRARFKAFTGQRCDWPQPKLLFWKDLILRVARRLRLCSAPARIVTDVWFARPGGLTPLCLPQVLEEMRADGEILLKSELIDPASGSLYQLVRRMSQMAVSKQPIVQDDVVVFKSLVEERAAYIVEQLRNSHWTSTCILTISKFNTFFHGREDCHVALCYLTQCGKARYIVDRRQDSVEGVKFSLMAAQVPAVSKLDYDTLHLIWTEEKLQHQLDVLHRQWEISRRRALLSFKSGDKQAAYRYARQSKLFSESRKRCTPLLERVEEVISLIANAETTKKVNEAIKISIQAMKEHHVSIEEVNEHLKEVDDLVATQREIDGAIGSVILQSIDSKENIEEEFMKLEAELQDEIPHIQEDPVSHANEELPDEDVDSLSNDLSNIKLEAI
uniref:Charged multivesicular body protein 7 n=1 Tax=Leersia perrieri TaxID=77586 RepID=A0A0D9UZU2_9ORYZ